MSQLSALGTNLASCLENLMHPEEHNILCSNQFDSQNERICQWTLPSRFNDQQQLFFENKMLLFAIEQALNMAKIEQDSLRQRRVGICIGTTSGCTTSDTIFTKTFYNSYENRDWLSTFQLLNVNQPAFFIAKTFNTHGPICTINNACTSGSDAIGIGKQWLELDLCDLVICGGVDRILENMHLGFNSLKLISQTHTKPFDQLRDGLVLSEGCGLVILEKMQQAEKRQVQPIIKISGYGTCSDAFHPTAPHPEARGLKIATTLALADAKIKQDDIHFINAHATGTQTNDDVEGKFIALHFPESHTFATKGYTGHTLAAAGAIEAVISSLCIIHSFIPKTLGFQSLDPEINLKPTTECIHKPVKRILSNSLGFGGAATVLILETI